MHPVPRNMELMAWASSALFAHIGGDFVEHYHDYSVLRTPYPYSVERPAPLSIEQHATNKKLVDIRFIQLPKHTDKIE